MVFQNILYPLWYNTNEIYYLCTQRVYHMTQLAKYVKEMRKQYGLTQVDLSQKSGVGLRFVRELEQGKSTLRLDKVNQVLAMFGAEMTPAKIIKA